MNFKQLTPLQIVWFKRDLRIVDHFPLYNALKSGRAIGVYFFEPSITKAADYALQHANFTKECLEELNGSLQSLNVSLVVFHCEILDVLRLLLQQGESIVLHSHEETGNDLSYQRDLSVKSWCKQHQVQWHEIPSHGVVRALKNRDDWSAEWTDRMQSPLVAIPVAQHTKVDFVAAVLRLKELTKAPILNEPQHDKPLRLLGGRSRAIELLDSFLQGRALDYRSEMSSPLTAQTACSRLSPYIAMGVLSVKEVVHRLWKARRAESLSALPFTSATEKSRYLASLKSFESRLHWRCHFVQKLESQPSIEFKNMHPAYDQLRCEPVDPITLSAWAKGETGFPMIDACMRMLLQTGWVNFRMRAMLVSFSSYQLWQHWREPALHLARQFLDYEPGIHYSQLQMQSGTTGINTIRMYNPVKQARDQDPDGVFVRHWIPALAKVPDQWIFEPWKMPRIIQEQVGCQIGADYPAPIVDLQEASKRARDLVWGVRDEPQFGKKAQAVFQKLGSRNKLREGQTIRQKKTALLVNADPQLDLFGATQE